MADPRFRGTQEPNDRDDRVRERSGYNGRFNRSSAAEYEAAGEFGSDDWRGRERNDGGGYGSAGYGGGGGMGWRGDDYRGDGEMRERSDAWRGGYAGDWGRDQGRFDRSAYGAGRGGAARDYDRAGARNVRAERGFFDRAGDEVRSWFGDEDAERRREQDARDSDSHYRNWRARQVADLDRDYDEYRRENAQKFENEFGSWRSERQGQRSSLQRVSEQMEVVGSDGAHVGTVDKVRGDRIILTKGDADAQGHHHSIPSRWIESVDDKVRIRKTADEAKAHWRDEERSGAMFGDGREREETSSPSYGGFLRSN